MLKSKYMATTPTRTHNHPSPSGDQYSAIAEHRRGQEAAARLLRGVYQLDEVRNGTVSASEQLDSVANQAEQEGHHSDASMLRVVGWAPAYAENQQLLNEARRQANEEDITLGRATPDTRRQIRELRERIFDYNAVIKEYLDLHPSDSLDYVVSFATTGYQSLSAQEGKERIPARTVFSNIYNTARGMRGELVAEQILGRFEDVEIHYRLTDDESMRRKLDAAGTDYMVGVSLLGHTFDLALDIKVGKQNTVDKDGAPLAGKLWCQCSDNDFPDNTSRIDKRAMSYKFLPMQDALIEQILLQYPGELEALCAREGTTLSELDIN